MVTEELHSITFEAQICLYGLTIELEVGVSRNIAYSLLLPSGPGQHVQINTSVFPRS